MTLRLSDEQRDLRDAVRVLADERIAPRAAAIDASAEFPWDVVELLARHDILALPFPVEHGGLGGDRRCRSAWPSSDPAGPAPRAGSSSPFTRWAPAVAAGGTRSSAARWVPDLTPVARWRPSLHGVRSGSDAGAARTAARRDGDRWRIGGTKRFISRGNVARVVATFAVTDGDERPWRSAI
jgi:alkylation response protein AidB-like acyl-CoA dehydrogenase